MIFNWKYFNAYDIIPIILLVGVKLLLIKYILVLCLVLLFAACDNNNYNQPIIDPTPSPTPIPTSTPTQEPEHEPAPATPATITTSPFPFAFATEDLQGNHVTEASLGDKELFFIYFWTTWCPSCVRGIPGLVQLAEYYSDRVGFLSMLGDFDTARDVAINITEDANAPFITVDALYDDFYPLLPLLASRFVPTSIIIDGDGNMIGEQIIGSDTERFRTAIEYALSR